MIWSLFISVTIWDALWNALYNIYHTFCIYTCIYTVTFFFRTVSHMLYLESNIFCIRNEQCRDWHWKEECAYLFRSSLYFCTRGFSSGLSGSQRYTENVLSLASASRIAVVCTVLTRKTWNSGILVETHNKTRNGTPRLCITYHISRICIIYYAYIIYIVKHKKGERSNSWAVISMQTYRSSLREAWILRKEEQLLNDGGSK